MSYLANRRLKSIIWRILRKKQFDHIRPKLCHTSLFKIEGKTRKSNFDIAILTFARKELAIYMSKISCIDKPEPMVVGKISFQEIPLATADAKPDIAFVGASPSFSKFLISNDFLLMPYVNFSLEISDSLNSIIAKMHRTKRKKIRRIEKLGYTYEITKDLEKLKLFYYKMYVPRIVSRHGRSAELVEFSECKRLFRKGGLLLVKLDGKCVSGAIYVSHGHTIYIPTLGFLKENIDPTENVGLLPLYFLILWGKENGYTKIDYGSCQPFLRSGVFRYKRELGMRVQPIFCSNFRIIAVKFCNFDRGAQDFISSNPFIFADGEKSRGLVIFNPKEDLHNFYVPGLSALDIICPIQHVSKLKQKYPTISKANYGKSVPLTSLLTATSGVSHEIYTLRL